MSTNQVILNKTLVDYIRLATYDYQKYLKLIAKIRLRHTGWKPAKWLQYKGQRAEDGTFYGAGIQGSKSHTIIQASGQVAHDVWLWFNNFPEHIKLAFYCTRIDLQQTRRKPETFDALKAYKRLRGKKGLILSDTGHTLYIGARKSDTFWRIYDKTETALRVEIELKGALAKRSFSALRNDESISSVWNRHLLRSKCPQLLVDAYRDSGEPAELPEDETAEDLQAKLDWMKTLDALAYKLANDHDTGQEANNLFSRWAEYGQKADD